MSGTYLAVDGADEDLFVGERQRGVRGSQESLRLSRSFNLKLYEGIRGKKQRRRRRGRGRRRRRIYRGGRGSFFVLGDLFFHRSQSNDNKE